MSKLTTPQDIVLRALNKLTGGAGMMPVTGPEIGYATGNFSEWATPRLNQLERKGLAERTGGTSSTGAGCWRITDAGREALREQS